MRIRLRVQLPSGIPLSYPFEEQVFEAPDFTVIPLPGDRIVISGTDMEVKRRVYDFKNKEAIVTLLVDH